MAKETEDALRSVYGTVDVTEEEWWIRIGKWMDAHKLLHPAGYLVVDIETDGLSPVDNNILQLSALLALPDYTRQYTYFVSVDEAALAAYEAGEYVAMRKAAGTDYVKASDVREHGRPASEVLGELAKLIRSASDAGVCIVGHNIIGFDKGFIERQADKAGVPISIRQNLVVDTGMLYKASRLGMLPTSFEGPWLFFNKVRNKWARVKWNLAEATRVLVSPDIDMSGAHSADYDCQATLRLLMQMKSLMLKPQLQENES